MPTASPSPDQARTWPRWAIEPITIADYDPAWADQGAHAQNRLQGLLATWLTGEIEHVGSTAIPGLAAKPIIDLQAPVADLAAAAAMVAAALAPHGWHHVPPELDQRPDRRFFVQVVNGHRVAHLHLMTTGSARWHQQLAFRDALRADPDLLKAYARLKIDLAGQHGEDREAYTAGKRQFVHDVLARNA